MSDQVEYYEEHIVMPNGVKCKSLKEVAEWFETYYDDEKVNYSGGYEVSEEEVEEAIDLLDHLDEKNGD